MMVSTRSNNNGRMSSSRRRTSNNNGSVAAASAAVASGPVRTTSLSDRLVLSLTRRGGGGGGGNDSTASSDYNMNDEGSSSTIDGLQSEEFRFITATAPSHSIPMDEEGFSEEQQPGRLNQHGVSGSSRRRTSLQQQRRPSKQLLQCLTSFGEEEEGEELESSHFEGDGSGGDDNSQDRSDNTEEDYDYDGYRDDDDVVVATSAEAGVIGEEKEPLSSVLAKIEAAEQSERQLQQQPSLPLDEDEKAMVLAAVAAADQHEQHRHQQKEEEERHRRQTLHEEQQRRLLQQQEEQVLAIQQQPQQQHHLQQQHESLLNGGSDHSQTFATRVAFDGSLVESPKRQSSASSLMNDRNQNGASTPDGDNPNERQLQLQLEQLEQLQAQLCALTSQQEQVEGQQEIAAAKANTSPSADTNLRLTLQDYRIPSKASLMDESEQDEEASIVQDYRFEQLTRSPSFKARAEALAAASVGVLNDGGGSAGMMTNFEWNNNNMAYSEEVLNEINIVSEGDEDEFRSTSESSSQSSRTCSSMMALDDNELTQGSQDNETEAAKAAAASRVLNNFLNNGNEDGQGDNDNRLSNAIYNNSINQYQRPSKASMMEEVKDQSIESDDSVAVCDDNVDYKMSSKAELKSNITELGYANNEKVDQEGRAYRIPSKSAMAETNTTEECIDKLDEGGNARDMKPAAKKQTTDKPTTALSTPLAYGQRLHDGSITTGGGGSCGTEATAFTTTAQTEQSSKGHLTRSAVENGTDKALAAAGPARAAARRSVSMSFLLRSTSSSSNVVAAVATRNFSRRQSQKEFKTQQSSSEPTSRISRKFLLPKLARTLSETAVDATTAAARTTSSSGIGGVFRGKDSRQRSTSARLNEPAVAPGAVAIRGVDKSDSSELYDEVYDISGTFSANSSKEFLMGRSNDRNQQRRPSRSAHARRSFARKLSGAYNILARDVSVVTAEMDIPDYEQERLELQRRVEEMESRIRNSVAAIAVPEQQGNGIVTSVTSAVTRTTARGSVSSSDLMANYSARTSSYASSDVENQRSSRTDSLRDDVGALATIQSDYLSSARTGDEAEFSGTKSSESNISKKLRKGNCIIGIVVIVAVFTIAISIGATRKQQNAELIVSSSTQAPAAFNSSSNDDAPSKSTPEVRPPLRPTLEQITERGTLICRAEPVEVQQGAGISIDLCRALAAAILGDPEKVEMPMISFRDQWSSLDRGMVDISTSLTTYNMDRDVREANSGGKSFTYSTPLVYAGSTFVGDPFYVDCADRGETLLGNCRGLSVCVMDSSATLTVIEDMLDGSNTVVVPTAEALLTNFIDGTCNVIAGPDLLVNQEALVRSTGFEGPFVLGPHVYDKLPMTIISRGDDPEFGDLVNWILRSLFVADSMGITQTTADLFPTTSLWGEELGDMFQNAIATIGNYGELYGKWFEDRITQQGLNLLYTQGDSGLMYSMPFGDTLLDTKLKSKDVPRPVSGGTLERISQRGYLNCGIVDVGHGDESPAGQRPGFATWNATSDSWMGIDVDFCRGLSAALFSGDVDRVKYRVFPTISDGFAALNRNQDVDLLAGADYNMINDIREPTTGAGFSFGPVYYFDQVNGMVAYAMATREDDEQWFDFTTWLVYGTLYAEEYSLDAGNMPVIELFGEQYKQWLRDAILAIGHYGQIYERNLAPYVPRSGPNLINTGNDPQINALWEFV